MKTVAFFLLLIAWRSPARAQVDFDPEKMVRVNDSLLFNVGFNHCDLTQFEKLLSDTFAFYHDKAGVTPSKAAFLKDLRENHCAMNYRARRELVPGDMKVFLLHRNDTIYGALQLGSHRFYAVEEGKPDRLTSTARFSHTWLFEEGELRLSRVISYDHREPRRKNSKKSINNRSPQKR